MWSYFKIIFMVLIIFIAISPCSSYAMDPVTIAILAPIAIKGAKVATPYVIRGVQCGCQHMLKMGHNIVDIGRLPLGVTQTTVGLPFNQFRPGLKNIVRGTIAPIDLGVNAVLLPVAFSGMNFN